MFQGIPGFSIGSYGYAGLGDTYGANNPSPDLWQFDPSTNSWAKKTSFPGSARVAPASFVICDKAYLVTGSIQNAGICVTECWEYNSTTNTWTQKADFPGGARTYAVGFAIDSLGYVGTGAYELGDFYKDFYAYHPSTNTWTRIADFGGIARSGASGFTVNGKGYVCFGQDSTIKNHNDMWEYDPSTNKWTQKSNSPGPGLLGTNGFSICDNIYVGSGDSTASFGATDHRFWKYNATTDSWTREANAPAPTRIQGAAFAIGDTGYYGFGADSVVRVLNIFDRFYAGDTCLNIDSSCNANTGYTIIHNVSHISIYPNPTNQKLNISFNRQISGLATLSIMDITGREVLSCMKNINNDITQIDVSSLASGMYFIQIKNKDTYVTQKFIKQ